jgi:hypothetical protein
MAQADLEPLASRTHSPVPNSRDRRIPDEFFWKVATAIGMISLFALLLISSHDRFSPLPARLEGIQREVPFRRVLAQSDEVSAKTITMEPRRRRLRRTNKPSMPRSLEEACQPFPARS